MINLVYFVRPMPDRPELAKLSTELRYSLRSVEANLAELGEVHVFGGRPSWLTGRAISHRVRQTGGKHQNTWALWREIAAECERGRLPEMFLLMNDDFFCMRPTTAVPPMYHGTLGQWTAARQFEGSGASARMMAWTGDVLAELGTVVGPARVFELHVPLPILAENFARLVPALDPYMRRQRLAKRTAYANLAGMNIDAVELAGDVKVRTNADPLPDGAWWSTSDESFRYRSVSSAGAAIRAMFPRPSSYESC